MLTWCASTCPGQCIDIHAPCSHARQYDATYVEQLPWLYQHLQNSTFVPADYKKDFYRGPYAYAATDFTGFGCATSACPTGDDPTTSTGVNEVQRLSCTASSGLFFLTFRGNTTLPILYNANAATLQKRLQQLFTIGNVSVTYSVAGGTAICDVRYPHTPYIRLRVTPIDVIWYRPPLPPPTTSNSVNIEFLTEYGDVPLLTATLTSLTYTAFTLTETQKGTKEDVECSRMGTCNPSTGRCACVGAFSSSNGSVTTPGSRGDCTYFSPYRTATAGAPT